MGRGRYSQARCRFDSRMRQEGSMTQNRYAASHTQRGSATQRSRRFRWRASLRKRTSSHHVSTYWCRRKPLVRRNSYAASDGYRNEFSCSSHSLCVRKLKIRVSSFSLAFAETFPEAVKASMHIW